MTAVTEFDIAAEVEFRRARKRLPTGFLVAALILAALAALAAVQYFAHNSTVVATDDAMLQTETVAIVNRVPGRVRQVLVAENGVVQAGQILAELDSRTVDSRALAAQGELAAVQAAAQTLQARTREARSGLAHARADFVAGVSEYKRLSVEINRYRPLVQQGAEPADKLASLIGQRRAAAANIAALRAAIGAAAARVEASRAQIGETSAQRVSASAGLDLARFDQEDTRIVAPATGRLSAVTIRQGQFLQAGQKLATITPQGQIFVLANFKETQIAALRPGQPVRVFLDSLPDVAIVGKVESLSPGTKASAAILPAQNASGNFTRVVQRVPVRISIDPPAQYRHLMINGLSAAVEVETAASAGKR